MLPFGCSEIFRDLKEGLLLENLNNYSNDTLRPFIPLLMTSAFQRDSSIGLEDPYLDALRARLIEMPIGNQFFRFMRLDYGALKPHEVRDAINDLTDSSLMDFTQKSEIEKVKIICQHMLNRMQFSGSLSLPMQITSENFYPFDSDLCHEEVVWILFLLNYYIPSEFSISQVVRCLLNYKNSPPLIASLVLNHPEFLEDTLNSLNSYTMSDEDDFASKQLCETTKKLLQLDPNQAQQYISSHIEDDAYVKQSVEMLCVNSLDDRFFIDTVVAELSDKNSKFSSHVMKSPNKNAFKKICHRVEQVLSCSNSSDAEGELDDRVILLIALIISSPSFRPTVEESQKWITFLTRPSINRCMLIKAILATIIASPNVLPDQVSFRDDFIECNLVQFFLRIRRLAVQPGYSSLSQFMLLIAIHMITDRPDDLANLLTSILGYPVGKTLHKQPLVRKLYLDNAVTGRDIAEKAASITITEDLNAKISGYLPIHCISYLLYSRSFSRYKIPIQDWIKRQICNCTVPIHSHIPSLLENFANSCIPVDEAQSFTRTIDEEFFLQVFSGDVFDKSKLPIRILCLYYLVIYTYKLEIANIPKEIVGTKNAPSSYSKQLWTNIPIRYLLVMMDSMNKDFHYIRAPLLHFITASMQHLLPDLDCTLSYINDQISTRLPFGAHIDNHELNFAIENLPSMAESKLCVIMDQLERSAIQEQYNHYESIVKAMRVSLDNTLSRPLLDKICFIWRRFENIIPQRLYEDTLKIWLDGPFSAISADESSKINNEVLLAETPLILFRIDERVFRSPPHFRCFIRILVFYLEAVRNSNVVRLTKASIEFKKTDMDEKHQLFKSFTGSQHLTVVQILIELCNGDVNELPELQEIREIACEQIHQMFIADTHLPKLVHFNTYPIHLIPVVVKGVPSTHVLINFIGELLTNASLRRRIFSICLMAELIEQYKIPSAFAGVTLVDDLLTSMSSCTINEELIILLLHVIGALGRLARSSPFHYSNIVEFMQRFRKILASRIAIYPSIISARRSPERKLLNRIDHTLQEVAVMP